MAAIIATAPNFFFPAVIILAPTFVLESNLKPRNYVQLIHIQYIEGCR
jgi:hypothetical protein